VDRGLGEVVFDLRVAIAPKKKEIPDNGFLTFCYFSADSGATDASELPPHETASETLR
jgi:hypothetical protein